MKKLIGLSALLSLTLLATAASAGGRPRVLERFDRVARPTPGAVFVKSEKQVTERARATVSHQRTARPAALERLRIRGDVEVGKASRARHAERTGAVSASKIKNPFERPVRCAEGHCGPVERGTTSRTEQRLTRQNNNDVLARERIRLRNKVIYDTIMAKAMQKMHPGKL